VVTAAINAAVLILGGIEDWRIVAATMLGAYLVLAIVEGLILGLTAGFLLKVKPELLGIRVGSDLASVT
jgi:ABC-type Co2+ transport system permease subunit